MVEPESRREVSRYPAVSLGAEHLVMGHLLRRNVLTYKAPPGNEGYDLICIHPDPRVSGRQIRVQVKSRMQTDCDRSVPVKEKTVDAFDFLVVVFLNLGYYFHMARRHPVREGVRAPEFYTLSPEFIQQHRVPSSSWGKVSLRGLDLSPFRDEAGFELIARALNIPYPAKRAEA